MKAKFKLAAYAVLLLMAAWLGWGFYKNYSTAAREAVVAATNDTASVPTNNLVGATNSSNAPNASTNIAARNGPAPSNTVAAPAGHAPPAPAPPAHVNQGTMIGYLAALIGVVIALGLLIAHDVTQYLGGVAVDALLDDRGEGMRDPEYERAEQAWADGKFLDAIQIMRDFLKTNPREQYAALRIAEIYEKDLHNLLAAALEYEEVLKKKLPPERWGWAAVHLCNLYSKLGQQEKTRALLQRIAGEYPQTAAAKKARSRLGLPEPEPAPVSKDGSTETAAPSGENAPPVGTEQPAPAPPEPPKSSLPPGFRPKN